MTRQRVLVVDDHSGTLDALGLLLEMFGHESRSARSGHEAIVEAVSFDPTLVILDIGLSDMSGYEVARALRDICGSRPHITAITGWSRPEKRRLAIDAGCNDYVIKPADASTLRAILEAMEARAKCLPTSDNHP